MFSSYRNVFAGILLTQNVTKPHRRHETVTNFAKLERLRVSSPVYLSTFSQVPHLIVKTEKNEQEAAVNLRSWLWESASILIPLRGNIAKLFLFAFSVFMFCCHKKVSQRCQKIREKLNGWNFHCTIESSVKWKEQRNENLFRFVYLMNHENENVLSG